MVWEFYREMFWKYILSPLIKPVFTDFISPFNLQGESVYHCISL